MIIGRKGKPTGCLGEDAEKLQPSGTARHNVSGAAPSGSSLAIP